MYVGTGLVRFCHSKTLPEPSLTQFWTNQIAEYMLKNHHFLLVFVSLGPAIKSENVG